MQDMISKGRQHKCWGNSYANKELNQYKKDWTFIKTWNSTYNIQNTLWIDQGNISRVCNWKSKTAWGFIWKFTT